MDDWSLEISPSNRAICKECGKKISMSVIRWKCDVYEQLYGQSKSKYYHYDCGCGMLEDIRDSVRDMMRQAEVDKQKYDAILKKLKPKND